MNFVISCTLLRCHDLDFGENDFKLMWNLQLTTCRDVDGADDDVAVVVVEVVAAPAALALAFLDSIENCNFLCSMFRKVNFYLFFQKKLATCLGSGGCSKP